MRIVRILNKFIEHSIAIFATDELAQLLKTPIYLLTALFCRHGGIELAFKKLKQLRIAGYWARQRDHVTHELFPGSVPLQ